MLTMFGRGLAPRKRSRAEIKTPQSSNLYLKVVWRKFPYSKYSSKNLRRAEFQNPESAWRQYRPTQLQVKLQNQGEASHHSKITLRAAPAPSPYSPTQPKSKVKNQGECFAPSKFTLKEIPKFKIFNKTLGHPAEASARRGAKHSPKSNVPSPKYRLIWKIKNFIIFRGLMVTKIGRVLRL